MKPLKAGIAEADITPPLPAALSGQYYERIAREVRSGLRAAVLALEGEDPAVFVVCDLLGFSARLLRQVRNLISEKVPELPPECIVGAATHIHTGPFLYRDDLSAFWGDDFWLNVEPGVTVPEEYSARLAEILAETVEKAWRSRRPVRIRSGFDHLAVAFPRRTVYADGTAKMYGSAARPDFKKMEGAGDTGIGFLALCDEAGKLLCAVVNVPCPAQILEHKTYIDADYWAEVRARFRERYGEEVTVLPFLSAAGDLSPRDLVRLAADERDLYSTPMYNEEGTRIMADKILRAFMDFYESDAPFEANPTVRRASAVPEIPIRTVEEREVEQARREYAALRARHADFAEFSEEERMMISLWCGIINRWERQKENPRHPTEIHCVQIGRTFVATDPFELFTEYADRIRAGSPARQTMVLQLACGYDGYLPTDEAVARGGYSAFAANGILGPEGGDMLVRETLKLLNEVYERGLRT